jgi:hypothetical protein
LSTLVQAHGNKKSDSADADEKEKEDGAPNTGSKPHTTGDKSKSAAKGKLP